MASTIKLELVADGDSELYGRLCNDLLALDGVLAFSVDTRTAASASQPTVTITYHSTRAADLAIAAYFGFGRFSDFVDELSAELDIER